MQLTRRKRVTLIERRHLGLFFYYIFASAPLWSRQIGIVPAPASKGRRLRPDAAILLQPGRALDVRPQLFREQSVTCRTGVPFPRAHRQHLARILLDVALAR